MTRSQMQRVSKLELALAKAWSHLLEAKALATAAQQPDRALAIATLMAAMEPLRRSVEKDDLP